MVGPVYPDDDPARHTVILPHFRRLSGVVRLKVAARGADAHPETR
jgi:hypothetical protein